jgi:hypothetical protein
MSAPFVSRMFSTSEQCTRKDLLGWVFNATKNNSSSTLVTRHPLGDLCGFLSGLDAIPFRPVSTIPPSRPTHNPSLPPDSHAKSTIEIAYNVRTQNQIIGPRTVRATQDTVNQRMAPFENRRINGCALPETLKDDIGFQVVNDIATPVSGQNVLCPQVLGTEQRHKASARA